MRNSVIFILIAATAIYTTFSCRQAEDIDPVAADMVIQNTTIYTANDAQWTAEAVAVTADKIVFVGSNTDAAAYIGENTVVHDMTGNTVYPGLTDAHVHLKWIGQRELGLNLQGIDDLSETVAKIKAYAGNVPDGEWVVGVGWIEKKWKEGRFLHKDDIDPFSAVAFQSQSLIPFHFKWQRPDGKYRDTTTIDCNSIEPRASLYEVCQV